MAHTAVILRTRKQDVGRPPRAGELHNQPHVSHEQKTAVLQRCQQHNHTTSHAQVRFERPSNDDGARKAYDDHRRLVITQGFEFEGRHFRHFTHKDADKEDSGDKGQTCVAASVVQ
jgi:hypothetical protein